ncbi:hypothetical protein [Vibrio anguillarum]|uniref:Uncharacterized protein n=1 Tax=Vibrio anguillarum TaxID=55601 RepID=A0ABR9Z964_VIBAN|nr:hypothetical protein [Vibrio anguillarum]MBF4374989.1 hypothetical protein [Vibrio anguillarum]
MKTFLSMAELDSALSNTRLFDTCETLLIEHFLSNTSMVGNKRFLCLCAKAYAQSVLTPMNNEERAQIPFKDLDQQQRQVALLRARARDEELLLQVINNARLEIEIY